MSDRPRGRPRHPDVLTPREWEVLSLVREGLTNAQIADQLGISRDAAKYHVGEILSKLGVSTREEAAAWQPQPAVAAVTRPAWASAAAPLAAFVRRLSFAGKVALVGASAAVIAGVGVLTYGVLQSGDDMSDDEVRASPSDATTTPGAIVPGEPPAFLSDVPIDPLRVGDDVVFPSDISIVTLLGCTNCDGPSYGVGRVYRDASAGVVVEPLMWTSSVEAGVDGPTNSLGLPQSGSYAVIGAAADATGQEIIAGVCCEGDETILFRSTDRGVSWTNYFTVPGTRAPLLIASPGQVLTGTYAFGESVPYQVFPSGEIIEPPQGALRPLLLDGDIAWITDGGQAIRDADGVLIDAGDPGDVTLQKPVFGPERGVISVFQSRDSNTDIYLAELATDYSVTRAFLSPDALIGDGVWLDGNRYLALAPYLADENRIPGQTYEGDFFGPLVPTIVDMDSGEVHAIADAAAGSMALSARAILAVETGTFARVSAAAGDCLNILDQPADDGKPLKCAAKGVLLAIVGPNQPNTGWLHVITPDDVEGYVPRDSLDLLSD